MSNNSVFPTWPIGNSEMGERIRTHEWASTSLGAIATWPQSLRTTVDLVLGCNVPMVILWGPELVQIYNDDYCGLLGPKHPASLGQPTRLCCPEVWHMNAPLYQEVLAGNASTFEDQPYSLTRSGSRKDAWFTLSNSPLRDERGAIVGILVIAFETTQHHLSQLAEAERAAALRANEAHQSFLLRLCDIALTLRDPLQIQSESTRLLGEHLGANRVGYAEDQGNGTHLMIARHYVHGVPSIGGTYAYDDLGPSFLNDFQAGQTVVRPDIAQDASLTKDEQTVYARLALGATINVPVFTGNQLSGVFFVHFQTAHDFTKDEVTLIEAVATRVWPLLNHVMEHIRAETDLRLLIDVLPAMIGYLDHEERYRFINTSYSHFFGRPREAILGRTVQEMVGDSVYARLQPGIAAAYRGAPVLIEDQEPNAYGPGQYRWMEEQYIPRIAADGTVEGIYVLLSDITERKHTEEALRASEAKYRTLFNSIDEGFCLMEMLPDANGKLVDVIHLEANPVYQRLSGIADIVGKRLLDIKPDVEPEWIEFYANVALTGHPNRREDHVDPLGRWFTVHASRVDGEGNRQLAVILDDITERKRAEFTLQESQERQAFFLKLSDALRPLNDPVAVQETAMQLLGVHLGVNRAFYGDMLDDEDTLLIGPGYAHELPALVGQVRFSEFDLDMVQTYRAGQTVVLTDIQLDSEFSAKAKAEFAAIQVQAAVGVPLVKGGKVRGILSIHQSAPRTWTVTEIAMLEETAERTWAAVERAKAEDALQVSEARLQAMFNQAAVGIIEAGLDRRLLRVNPGFFLMLGYSAEECLTLTVDEVTYPDDQALDHLWAARLLQGEIPAYTLEKRYRRKDGTFLWVSVTVSLIYDADDQPSYAVAIIQDIDARKRAQLTLQQSQERLQATVDQSAVGIIETDLNRHCVRVNPGFCRILGYSMKEALQLEMWKLTHPDDQLLDHAWYTSLLHGQVASYTLEKRYMHQTGGEIWVSDTVSLVRDTHGHPSYLTEIIEDIDARKRGELALRASEERFRTVANLIPDLLWSNTPTGYTTWYNQRWLDYTGQTLEEAQNQGWLQVIHPADRSVALTTFQRALDQGQPLKHLQRIKQRNGTYRWFLVRAEPVRDAQKHILQWVGAATDIHDQRLEQENLAEQVAVGEAQLRMLSHQLLRVQEDERRNLARELHDEIGQLLTGLQLQLAALERARTKQERALPLQQAYTILRDLTERVSALSLELRPSVLDNLGLLPALLWYLASFRKRTDIIVDLQHIGVDHRFPQEVEVTAYRLVQEGLTNIARHAQVSQASVQLIAEDQVLTIIIQDEGQGFDRTSTTGRGGVTGMYERVSLLGGTLEIDTAPGQGTMITAAIPYSKADLEALP